MMPRFLTRRAIAFMIVAFLLLPVPIFSEEVQTLDTPIFTDIQGHWAEEAIQKVADAGLVVGYGNGTFRPDQSITGAEFKIIILRLIQVASY